MGELSMGTVDVAPAAVEVDDRLDLVIEQSVHRVAAGGLVLELAGAAALHPAVGPQLAEVELPARPPEAPARRGSVVDQPKERLFGGRVDPGRDSATQPQRPFPSTSISCTAISFRASPSRAASARAASSSKSRSFARRPG